MTPTQPSQLAQDAVQRVLLLVRALSVSAAADGVRDCYPSDRTERAYCAVGEALRAELARPQEVAAEVTNEQADAIANACFTQIHATGYSGCMGGLQWDRALVRAAILASRAPVALPAERIKFLAENIAESIDGSDPSGAKATLHMLVDLVTTPTPKQGDANDARPGSFHSDSGECDRVQAPEVTLKKQFPDAWQAGFSGRPLVLGGGCPMDELQAYQEGRAAILASMAQANQNRRDDSDY